jgi:NDP-sugar pyrophosphorylase family protein
MNSDLLTNIDVEAFYNFFISSNADITVAAIPYHVDIPYAVLETDNDCVKSITEKPRYTFYSNAGIYLIKKDIISNIPVSKYFNATDLLQIVINNNGLVNSFPLNGYWLDIGKHEDYIKAQNDIKNRKIF